MKKNNYDRASGNASPFKKEVNLTEANGVYGHNPDPAVSEYKQSTGPDTIPVKFAEPQPVSKAPSNLVMGANGQESGNKAKIPTSSRANKSKNTYNSASDNKGRMGHY